MFPYFWRENSAWEHVLFIYIIFSVFVNKLIDRNKVFKLLLIKKIQCYVLELHSLGNT